MSVPNKKTTIDEYYGMSDRLALAESEVAISESKINELSAILSQTKEDMAAMAKNHQQELKRDREVKVMTIICTS